MIKKTIESTLNVILLLLLLMAAASYNGKLFGEKAEHFISNKTDNAHFEQPTEQQLRKLGLADLELSNESLGVWRLRKNDKQLLLIHSAAFSGHITGFAGPVPLYILLEEEARIKQIEVLDNDETPEFLEDVMSNGIVDQWIDKTIPEALKMRADVVSGATLSSNAINKGIQKSIAAISQSTTEKESSFFTIENILAICVVLFGAIVSTLALNTQRYRTILLVLNVVILGFWCGKFISIQILMGWVNNGIYLKSSAIILLMLILTFVMPILFNKKQYYCYWVCPFGSAQELAGKLCSKKYRINKRLNKILKHSRTAITLSLLIALWLGVAMDLTNYEPFTAFLFRHAPIGVIVIAAISLALSLITPRPWCRFVCPTGQLLSWINKMK